MRLKNLFYSALVLCTLLLSSQLFAKGVFPETVQLGYHLQAGTSYAMKTVTENNQSFTFNQQHYLEKSTTTSDLIFDIIGVDAEGNTTAKITFVDLNIQREPAQLEPEALRLQKRLGEMIKGQHFVITFTRAGKITNISGHEKLGDLICQQFPQGESKEFLCSLVDTLFSEEALKSSYSEQMGIYPSKAIAQGYSWTINAECSLFPKLIHKKTFTLGDAQQNQQVIKVVSKTTSPKQGATMNFGVMQINMTMNGSGNGTIIVDNETGWICSRRHVEEIKGTATTLPSPYIPEKITFPYALTSVITIESHKL